MTPFWYTGRMPFSIEKNRVYSILGAILFLVFGIFVANKFYLYQHFDHFDKLMHITGGIFAALIMWQFSPLPMTGWKRVVVLVAYACLIGVFWEFAERLSSVYCPTYCKVVHHYFQGGDLDDTLGDITADMVGGLLYGISFLIPQKK